MRIRSTSPRARARRLAALLALCLAFACAGAPALAETPAAAEASASADETLRGYDKSRKKAERYQYVQLGAYPQGENGETAPIVWRVLSADGERALLMSEYVLGVHPVHRDYFAYVDFGGEWTRTDAYAFMNGAFLEAAFTPEELTLLDENEPLGRMFYPSADDLKNAAYGFPKGTNGNASRNALGTAWALNNGLFRYSLRKGGHSPYWTRTQSKTLPSGSNCTKISGAVGYIRCIVADVGFRPCGYLMLDRAAIAGGSGSLNDPYTFSPLP